LWHYDFNFDPSAAQFKATTHIKGEFLRRAEDPETKEGSSRVKRAVRRYIIQHHCIRNLIPGDRHVKKEIDWFHPAPPATSSSDDSVSDPDDFFPLGQTEKKSREAPVDIFDLTEEAASPVKASSQKPASLSEPAILTLRFASSASKKTGKVAPKGTTVSSDKKPAGDIKGEKKKFGVEKKKAPPAQEPDKGDSYHLDLFYSLNTVPGQPRSNPHPEDSSAYLDWEADELQARAQDRKNRAARIRRVEEAADRAAQEKISNERAEYVDSFFDGVLKTTNERAQIKFPPADAPLAERLAVWIGLIDQWKEFLQHKRTGAPQPANTGGSEKAAQPSPAKPNKGNVTGSKRPADTEIGPAAKKRTPPSYEYADEASSFSFDLASFASLEEATAKWQEQFRIWATRRASEREKHLQQISKGPQEILGDRPPTEADFTAVRNKRPAGAATSTATGAAPKQDEDKREEECEDGKTGGQKRASGAEGTDESGASSKTGEQTEVPGTADAGATGTPAAIQISKQGEPESIPGGSEPAKHPTKGQEPATGRGPTQQPEEEAAGPSSGAARSEAKTPTGAGVPTTKEGPAGDS
jgi:hypothetical protein